eukprot:scaffold135140_cov31-Tisochrysis_lutea.AAC.7
MFSSARIGFDSSSSCVASRHSSYEGFVLVHDSPRPQLLGVVYERGEELKGGDKCEALEMGARRNCREKELEYQFGRALKESAHEPKQLLLAEGEHRCGKQPGEEGRRERRGARVER